MLVGGDLYVGDGASLTRPLRRTPDGYRVGHPSMREQFEWCTQIPVPNAIFTHCGSHIVARDEEAVAHRIKE